MIKVMSVFGTRPEAIKMAPLVQELARRKEINSLVCTTGQHQEMLEDVLAIFKIKPTYQLNVMKENQDLFDITAAVTLGLRDILKKERPDIVLVHGDTSTTFSTALACYYLQIPIGHVEAGLRTYNIYSPFPEEFNRRAVSLISSLNFAPTRQAKKHLLKEGFSEESIVVTGNTAIDALKTTVSSNYQHELLDWVGDNRLIMITAHRRENLGKPMEQMFQAIKRITQEHPDIRCIYPIHLNPQVIKTAQAILGDNQQIKLVKPMNVVDFHNFLNHSFLILTDSGGIQEEAPSLGKPVLVMRDTTERPEGVAAGTLKLTGTTEETIYQQFKLLLTDPAVYNKMSLAQNPYGDGTASKKIADAIIEKLT